MNPRIHNILTILLIVCSLLLTGTGTIDSSTSSIFSASNINQNEVLSHQTLLNMDTRARTWEVEVVDEEGIVGKDTSIAIDSNDNIHISYFDSTNHDLKYAMYNGTAWNITTLGDSRGYTFIAVDSHGYPHICHIRLLASYSIVYLHYNGSCWEEYIAVTNTSLGRHYYFTLDSKDRPHISYYYKPSEDLRYTFFNGTAWENTVVETQGSTGYYSSLALDSHDFPHISYHDGTHEDLKYAFSNGTAWTIQTVDSTGWTGYDSSIDMDSSDLPHISYYDYTEEDLNYASFNGTEWNISILDSDGRKGTCSSLVIDNDDHPHIAYTDSKNNGLKYIYYNGYQWNDETVDSCGDGIDFLSLAFDSRQLPHISYLEGRPNWNLRYAHLPDRRPIANAGPDVTIDQHETLDLTGIDSTDDFGIASYNWSFTYNDTDIHLHGMNASFTFDLVGRHEVLLNVTDTRGNWNIDSLNVTVRDNTLPVAVARADQYHIEQHRRVNFSGYESSDNLGIEHFRWHFWYGGELTKFEMVNFSFIFDEAGEYDVTLKVIDYQYNWAEANLTIHVDDTDVPVLTDDLSPSAGTTGDEYLFELDAQDNAGISSVTIEWNHGSRGGTAPLNDSGDHWSGSVILDHSPDPLRYTIFIEDTSGNIFSGTPITVPVADNDVPGIDDCKVIGEATTGEELEFGVEASDNIGLRYVYVNWTHGMKAGTLQLNGTGNEWTGVLKLDHDIAVLEYTVHAVDTSGNFMETPLDRIYVVDNDPPVAVPPPPIVCKQHENVSFDGSNSSDNVGSVELLWLFVYNDVEIGLHGIYAYFTFDLPGTYNVTLEVTDPSGNTDTASFEITVIDIELPCAAFSVSDEKPKAGDAVQFKGGKSTDNTGIANWTWTITGPGRDSSAYGENITISFPITGKYTVKLTVYDEAGNGNSVERSIEVGERADHVKPDDDDTDEKNKTEDGNMMNMMAVIGISILGFVCIGILAAVIVVLMMRRAKGGKDKEASGTDAGEEKEGGEEDKET